MPARKTALTKRLFSARKENSARACARDLRTFAHHFCHRRFLDDLEQASPLLVAQRLIGMQYALNVRLAGVVAREAQFGAEFAEVPALLLGVHAQRDRSARGERSQIVVERRRRRALPTERLGFIGGQIEMTRANPMQIVRA